MRTRPYLPTLRDLNALGQQRAHVLALCTAFSIDFAQMLHTVNPLPLLWVVYVKFSLKWLQAAFEVDTRMCFSACALHVCFFLLGRFVYLSFVYVRVRYQMYDNSKLMRCYGSICLIKHNSDLHDVGLFELGLFKKQRIGSILHRLLLQRYLTASIASLVLIHKIYWVKTIETKYIPFL